MSGGNRHYLKQRFTLQGEKYITPSLLYDGDVMDHLKHGLGPKATGMRKYGGRGTSMMPRVACPRLPNVISVAVRDVLDYAGPGTRPENF